MLYSIVRRRAERIRGKPSMDEVVRFVKVAHKPRPISDDERIVAQAPRTGRGNSTPPD